MISRILLAYFFSSVLIAQGAYADPQPSSDFFSRDFVVNAMEGSGPKKAGDNIATPAPTTPGGTPEMTFDFSDGVGKPVLWLGVTVDGRDLDPANAAVSRLLALLDRTKIRAGRVFIMRDPNKELDDSLKRAATALTMRGGRVLFITKLPEELPIQEWPTWIIQTAEGTTLLEGLKAADRHLNAQGQFIPPAMP